MGQQQLLLIVLGVIIVGIAVVVGINVFTASSEEAAKDAVVSDCTTIGAMAQQYYRKPTAMAGGGNSFVGFSVPAALLSNANGSYAASGATGGANAQVTITGLPADGDYDWRIVTTVTKDSVNSVFTEGRS
ncbi:MAG: hypothetical protein HND52_04640 [Ignavibacteriae bacterium]|nr:hypothetical protein [Ignavibacteriota bacterium]NOG97246.1 hypothetical protein [Ignavibacteriota bacterium]